MQILLESVEEAISLKRVTEPALDYLQPYAFGLLDKEDEQEEEEREEET